MFKNQDPDEDNLEDLSSFRDNLIHSIFIEFNQYFPTEDFNSLWIFEPKLMPTNPLITRNKLNLGFKTVFLWILLLTSV
jgi:hypothetical protein